MSLAEPASVDELLNYRLAKLIGAASAPGIRLLEGRYGVTRREWGLLGMVAAYGPISPSALSDRSHLGRAKVSLSLSSLAGKQLLVRASVSGDRRRAVITLTPSGRALYDKVFPQLAAISASVLAALTPQQVDDFDTIMRALLVAAERVAASQPVADKADRRHGGSRRIRSDSLTAASAPLKWPGASSGR